MMRRWLDSIRRRVVPQPPLRARPPAAAPAGVHPEHALLEKIGDALPGMVYQCRVTPTGHCSMIYASKAIEWIYEKTFDEVRDDCRGILDLVHPDDRKRVSRSLWESLRHLTPWKGEYRVVLPRQGVQWRMAHARVERQPGGGTLWSGFIADITWRKEIEARILAGKKRELTAARAACREAEHQRTLGTEFLAQMSHELRTPLTAIIGYAELVQAAPELQPETREHADLIMHSAEHLLRLVGNTVDLLKIDADRFRFDPQPFDVAETFRKNWEMLAPKATGKGLGYHLDLAPDLPAELIGDTLRLSQIVLNLLSNAIKYTSSGRVTLAVWISPEEEPGTRRLWAAVSDTGPGIAPADRERIFEPYCQLPPHRPDSSGLGLTITRRLCRLLGGDLTVESESGVGSRFVFSVLASAGAEPRSAENPDSPNFRTRATARG